MRRRKRRVGGGTSRPKKRVGWAAPGRFEVARRQTARYPSFFSRDRRFLRRACLASEDTAERTRQLDAGAGAHSASSSRAQLRRRRPPSTSRPRRRTLVSIVSAVVEASMRRRVDGLVRPPARRAAWQGPRAALPGPRCTTASALLAPHEEWPAESSFLPLDALLELEAHVLHLLFERRPELDHLEGLSQVLVALDGSLVVVPFLCCRCR